MIYKTTKLSLDGVLVPIFQDGLPMHSLYAAKKEAQKFLHNFSSDCGFAVIGGLGAGEHIKALLQQNPSIKVVAIEESTFDIEFLKNNIKLSFPENVEILPIEKAATFIKQHYTPALQGKIQVFCLMSWQKHISKQSLETLHQQITQTINDIKADCATQMRFGFLWQKNILKNTCTSPLFSSVFFDKAKSFAKKGLTAAVIAAGPTLDRSFLELIKNRANYYIIATDTAFRALCRRGIKADAVFCIDCQNISIEHFLPVSFLPTKENTDKNYFCSTDFVFDIGVSPSIVRLTQLNGADVFFIRTAHPLSKYINDLCDSLLEIQAGAGTVTTACTCFAVLAGFKKIKFFAADFGFFFNKPYTKGTYLFDLYNKKAFLTQTLETQFCSLMYHSPLIKDKNENLTTTLLQSYKNFQEQYLQNQGYKKQENLYYNPYARPAFYEQVFKMPHKDFTAQYKKKIAPLLQKKDFSSTQITPEIVTLLPYLLYKRAIKSI